MSQKHLWIGEIQKHIKHFQNRVAVCSCILYCDCELHDSISILLVQSHYENLFQLPGGRRDIVGSGRAQFKVQDESCMSTIVNEFKEEVGENLQDFTSDKLPYFHTKTYKGQIVRVYYHKIRCTHLPDKNYGRLRLFETISRKWTPLEIIVQSIADFRNRQQTSIHHGIEECIRQFCLLLTTIHLQKQLT